jgi:hypothetical protein
MVLKRFARLGAGIAPDTARKPVYDAPPTVKFRHFVGATIFIMASMIFCWYYVAFPLANLKFTHGYTRFGTPPSPNTFHSDRYTWGWVFIYIVSAVNLMLPYLLAAALLNNTIPEISKLHYKLSNATALVSIVTFIALSVSWLFFCNRYFPDYSYCHDIRHCCVYFASNPTWCPNTTPCVPNYNVGDLIRSDAFFQIWLFSLLFSFWALAHKDVNKDLRSYGLWREVFIQESPAEAEADEKEIE